MTKGDDQYVAEKLKRTLMHAAGFCMKDTIIQDLITATDFQQNIFQISQVNPNFTKQVEKMDWKQFRVVVRVMHKKYLNEDDHRSYDGLVKLSRKHFTNLSCY